jgi:hypothetical protein
MNDSGYTVDATFLYSGMIDYWGGDGDRWDDNAGCLFAHYGPASTLRDIIDDLVNDFIAGGDCDTLPEEVTDVDIRKALIEMLSDQGKEDYKIGALSEFAKEFAEVNGLKPGHPIDDLDDFGEVPVVIVLIRVSQE